ncbi:MAG: AAA family ATPase, partial [Candidatus Ornithospirochaeta sp.]
TKEEIRKELLSFLETLGLSGFTGVITEREITTRSFALALRDAEKNGYLENAEQTCITYTMNNLRDSILLTNNCEEEILDDDDEEDQSFSFNSVEEEKKRIFSLSSPQSFIGHPVHYIVISKDKEVRENMIEELLRALLKAGRIKGKRVVTTPIGNGNISRIYEYAKGCTVVLESDMDNDGDDIFYFLNDDIDRTIFSTVVEEHRNDVLSIFSIDSDKHRALKEVLDNLEGLNFVVLKEDLVYGDEAKKHLAAIARHDKTTETPGLEERVKEGEGYTYSGLNLLYRKWKDDMVSASFPAYSSFACQKEEKKKEAKGDAYKTLKSLIGLDRAKEIIDEAIAFNKMQGILLDRNIVPSFPCRHMVFYGAPGTAKTTVARLYAEILKDNGALSGGELIEVGRKDLVGKYVGWTAKQVEEIFKKAKGNVLFIDEAYSLTDGRDKLYGQEAINTIVQMMENMRDDVVVIFAGYEKEMEDFLSQNPGLMSRIPFHVHFDNYSETELMEILTLMAKERKYTLSPGTREKVLPIFRSAMVHKDFGNGRFVRNMLERAMMRQANRLTFSYSPEMSDSVLMTLIPDDFTAPDKLSSDQPLFMGFSA